MTYLNTQSVLTGVPAGRTPATGRALLVRSYPHIVPAENNVKILHLSHSWKVLKLHRDLKLVCL